jgi:hypothetical protein
MTIDECIPILANHTTSQVRVVGPVHIFERVPSALNRDCCHVVLSPGYNFGKIDAGCQNVQGIIPVQSTTTSSEFQANISAYLAQPLDSPYGSPINCWDASQVTNMAYAFLSSLFN